MSSPASSFRTYFLAFPFILTFFIPELSNARNPENCIKKVVSKFKFDYPNRLIRVHARVNEAPLDYTFILDSGAPTAVTDSLADKNRLKYVDTRNAVDANGNEQSFDILKVNRFRLEEQCYENVKVISNEDVARIPAVSGKANGGLIGANLMKNAVWMIDYKNLEITVAPHKDSLKLPQNYFSSRMYLSAGGNPMIDVKINEKSTIGVMVDLGYNGSLLLHPGLFEKDWFNASGNFAAGQKVSTAFASEEQFTTYKFLNQMRIGNLTIENVKTSSTGNNTVNLLGNEFLQDYTIVLDFISNTFILFREETEEKSKTPGSA